MPQCCTSPSFLSHIPPPKNRKISLGLVGPGDLNAEPTIFSDIVALLQELVLPEQVLDNRISAQNGSAELPSFGGSLLSLCGQLAKVRIWFAQLYVREVGGSGWSKKCCCESWFFLVSGTGSRNGPAENCCPCCRRRFALFVAVWIAS